MPDTITAPMPHVEKDPQIIEMAINAQMPISRTALLRCPRCKNPDAYTPGEKCLHCGYLETNALLIKRSKQLRYRLIPLMLARDFSAAIKTHRLSRSRTKYDPIAGALLEYEYAFALLFSPKISQIKSLQNLYRVLSTLDLALKKVLRTNLNDNNKALVSALKDNTQKQLHAIRQEFNNQNWALKKIVDSKYYPNHVKRKDYFQKATVVGDVLSVLNGLAEIGFSAASRLWEISEAVISGAGTVTDVGSFVLAPVSIAENVVRRKRDAKLQKQFQGTAMKAGETILNLPPAKQKKMIKDAINPKISSSQFAKKWGGRIDYNNVKTWQDAAEIHRQGKKRRTKRAVATVIGASLGIGSIVVTCGTAAIVLGAGATTIGILKVGDSASARIKKMSKSEQREAAAKEIVNSAITGEINAINLLGGLKIIDYPNHAKYLGFSALLLNFCQKKQEIEVGHMGCGFPALVIFIP